MPNLIWDRPEERTYETGLDRGVLYLPDGSAVPWNGLTSVSEISNSSTSPVYCDGIKINELVSLGEFSASMKALTYPDEFVELEGLGVLKRGVFLGDQKPKIFGLCYRTKIGDSFEDDKGYKIHIIYNVLAIPKDKNYATNQEEVSIVEFEWDITAIPEEVLGFHPTAHIIINSVDLDPWLLEEIEAILYGTDISVASLIPMADLVSHISEWFRVKITDNGDGTWTATSLRDGFINMLTVDLFEIVHVNAIYLDEDTFIISDTFDETDAPAIKILDNLDGTWTAYSDNESLIEVNMDGTFQIFNANFVMISANSYKLSDTLTID